MEPHDIVFDQETSCWYCGKYELAGNTGPPRIAIIGSRKTSPYGLTVIDSIVDGLRSYDCTIMSGLAMGTDQRALGAALERGMTCMGIPGSGLSPVAFTPVSAASLANTIVRTGGLILSPFAPDFVAQRWTFVVRNKLIIQLAALIVIPECEIGGGTFGTALRAMKMGVKVAVVPGSINAPLSAGTNELLVRGCHCIRNAADIIQLIGLQKKSVSAEASRWTENEYDFAERLHSMLTTTSAASPLSLESIMTSANANSATVERALCILIAEHKIIVQNGMILPVR